MRRIRGAVVAIFLLVQMGGTVGNAEPLLRAPISPLRTVTAVPACGSLVSQRLSEQAVVADASEQRSETGTPWCLATLVIPRSAAHNEIKVWVGLPIQNWNGRFLGIGGGGFLGGTSKGFMPTFDEAVSAGFVAASTDAGHAYLPGSEGETGGDGSFVLKPDGQLNWPAVATFAHLGIHQMTVLGKELTTKFYSVEPRYSYFSGCSTGGRQGQSEVQRYPADYDGVLSGAPAINWTHFLPAAMWGKVVMNEHHHLVAQCKLEVARKAAIASCDKFDSAMDGVIGRPDLCRFSAKSLVGRKTPCGTIDAADAAIIDAIWAGPKSMSGRQLWFGLPYSASFAFDTGGDGVKTYDGSPNPIAVSWYRYFLHQDPAWTPDRIDRAKFERDFGKSVQKFGEVFDTSNADLRPFSAKGGKTIIWHGLIDSNFPAGGTMKYVDRVRRIVGARQTDEFLRLYLVPGVEHCGGGNGPQPEGLLQVLIDWVEHNRPPEVIMAETLGEEGFPKAAWELKPYRGDHSQAYAEPVNR